MLLNSANEFYQTQKQIKHNQYEIYCNYDITFDFPVSDEICGHQFNGTLRDPRGPNAGYKTGSVRYK